MGKLNDIAGYWDMSGRYNFNDNVMWKGKFILEDDGWFEGIVVDPNSSYTGSRLVFGIYHPEKVIELLKVAPKEVSNPFVFRGRRDAKGYDGTFSVIGTFGEIKTGVSHIITQDVEAEQALATPGTAPRDIEAEKQKLQRQIEDFKASNHFSDLYTNTCKMRKSLSKIILKSYQGRGFTVTEKQQINDECRPVNQQIRQKQQEAAKQYVKTSKNSNDDLPF